MRTIVVGIDSSDHSARALSWAVNEADLTDARLVAVHAWTTPLLPFGAAMAGALPEPAEYRSNQLAIAEDTAERAVLTAEAAGHVIDVRTPEGPAADVLIEAALAEEADLLVVGTRRHGGVAALLLGSVSGHLARHAPCPVVIVPDRAAD